MVFIFIPFSFTNMKEFIKKHAARIVGLAPVVGAVMVPLSAHAAFGSGMTLPAGTTTNVVGAINDYFFPTVLATLFQDQVIQIVVALAALGVTWFAVRMVIGKIMHPHR